MIIYGRKDIEEVDGDLIDAINEYLLEQGISMLRLSKDMNVTYPTARKIFCGGCRTVSRRTNSAIKRYAGEHGIDVELYREIL